MSTRERRDDRREQSGSGAPGPTGSSDAFAAAERAHRRTERNLEHGLSDDSETFLGNVLQTIGE